MKIKIYGCGSIGNHIAHASRLLGWSVCMVDNDPKALLRTKKNIYPSRYGKWDPCIGLFTSGSEPCGGFDLIHIGTPPATHLSLALSCLQEKPKGILIEKPLSEPSLRGLNSLLKNAQKKEVQLYIGYDHVVGQAAQRCAEILRSGVLGAVESLDVEFREFWGGIFEAHPWLRGPQDSYLGFWKLGGGAGGEHSHALNLWQFFARCCGAGEISEVSCFAKFKKNAGTDYDSIFSLNLKTTKSLIGRVIQDVVTHPPKKWARIQGTRGYLEWHCGGGRNGADRIILGRINIPTEKIDFPKTRPQDFVMELKHLRKKLKNRCKKTSPLAAEFGIKTMRVIQAAYRSAQTGKTFRLRTPKKKSKNANKKKQKPCNCS